MSKFGWSYPPGCSEVPDDQEPTQFCEACGREKGETIGWTCDDRKACEASIQKMIENEYLNYEFDTEYLDAQYERDNNLGG